MALSLIFLACTFAYSEMANDTRLNQSTQARSGRNFWAMASATGETIQVRRMTGHRLRETVALNWCICRAPVMVATAKRCTKAWIGATCLERRER
jgi:hypothetical protein